MVGIAMGLKCPVCAAEDRADSLLMCLRDPTTKQAGHFRPTRMASCRRGEIIIQRNHGYSSHNDVMAPI